MLNVLDLFRKRINAGEDDGHAGSICRLRPLKQVFAEDEDGRPRPPWRPATPMELHAYKCRYLSGRRWWRRRIAAVGSSTSDTTRVPILIHEVGGGNFEGMMWTNYQKLWCDPRYHFLRQFQHEIADGALALEVRY